MVVEAAYSRWYARFCRRVEVSGLNQVAYMHGVCRIEWILRDGVPDALHPVSHIDGRGYRENSYNPAPYGSITYDARRLLLW